MGKIGNQYFDGGVAPNASQLNTVYDAVAGDSINDQNIETDCLNRTHFSDTTANRINQLFTFDYGGSTDWATSSTTMATIANGLSLSKVLPAYTTHGNVVVRVQATGLVSELTLPGTPSGGNGTPAQINRNTYAFRLLMTLNSGGSTVDVANATYSFNVLSSQRTNTSYNATTNPIQWRSFGFSGLCTLAPGVTIDSVELQGCVGFASNTLRVQHNHIQVIVVEN
tara:strand:- start:3027 stop:3701 length:675 start_codon:yes stop_codon:yes gene_type:complete